MTVKAVSIMFSFVMMSVCLSPCCGLRPLFISPAVGCASVSVMTGPADARRHRNHT